MSFRYFTILTALCLLHAGTVFATSSEIITDAMSDDELRAYRKARVSEIAKRAREYRKQTDAEGRRTFPNIFFCTVYYTPKESGFTAERGFDATPATAPGLRGRKFPRSFLEAVKKEGFGRMVTPVNGRNYLQYVGGGRYAFAKAALGSRGNVLVPGKSCAVSTRNRFLRQHMNLILKSQTVNEELKSEEWEVADTGGGVHPLQIDLYWGEDEPRGAVGRQRARPSGTWMEYSFEVVVTVK